MKITPAIKGQLTKAIKSADSANDSRKVWLRQVFAKHMPREQAKHAARKYIAGIA